MGTEEVVGVSTVPAVRFHVAAEIAGVCKACFTHSANVRLLASMRAHVYCQITGVTTYVRTHISHANDFSPVWVRM